jgi:hypothetical protein
MPPRQSNVLLVEGRDDREVIYQLCNSRNIDNGSMFEVVAKEGYEKLRDDLSVRPRTAVSILGAVVDADENMSARWTSVRAALEQSGYALPHELPADGLILSSSNSLPRLGIWLMPNNRSSGMLEDFLRSLATDDDGLLLRAQKTVSDLPESLRRFQARHFSKAVIHTWLAWQEDPGTPLGLAITRRYLDPNRANAEAFLNWLTELFLPRTTLSPERQPPP